MRLCLETGCQRAPRPGYARCDACHAALLLTDITSPRAARPGPLWGRVVVKPLPEITESELTHDMPVGGPGRGAMKP